ncbi:MAG: SufS family cysteine desulfurase [Eubacterium sp.]|nr:SufS family cysteine desulfurase [Eubacterium sp.]
MCENVWRKDFPILEQEIYGKRLIYLDNGATAQMPSQVAERIREHYEKEHGNIHRGIHYLSEKSTQDVEHARELVKDFIHAEHVESIVFTQGATDSIHLVSAGIALEQGSAGGIVTTQLEHHSNYVPWQQICKQTGRQFFVCPAPDGELDLQALEDILRKNEIRLVACAHVTNVTGTVNPIKEIIEMVHRYGAEVLIDGAQGILHQTVDVKSLDCEYYCFSGHKMIGPTGVGVLYGKKECLEKLEPARYGGGMVDLVKEEETTWGPLPYRFEAGTPNIGGIIGLGEAVTYLTEHDIEAMHEYESKLLAYALEKISAIPYVEILGHPAKRAGAISFAVEGAHPYDIASMLDKAAIAVRSGSHCAQPMLECLGVNATVRVTPNFYNTYEEIDVFCETLVKVITLLRKYSA